MSLSNDFQKLYASLRQVKKQVADQADLAERALWRSLEWGKPEEITDLAQKYDTLRQKNEIIDDTLLLCQDVSQNLNLIFNGNASESLIDKYSKLASASRIVNAPEFNEFIQKYPPSKRYPFQIKPLAKEELPKYIRRYMIENKITPEIKEKVYKKFPLPLEQRNSTQFQLPGRSSSTEFTTPQPSTHISYPTISYPSVD